MSQQTLTHKPTYSEPSVAQLITFEQPLNEHTRLYLRLEHLFSQLQNHLRSAGTYASTQALETLLRIVDLADRPDLKSKLLQTLRQQSTTLAQLESLEHIELDTSKLQNILHQLDRLVDGLHAHGSTKLGDSLRQNPFLKSIRLHLNNPAGPCKFNIPAYALWLHQNAQMRLTNLSSWAKEFDLLKEAISLILNLTRNSSPPQQVTAINRFYQQTLESSIPCQLIRITIPCSYNLYPEFSVGKHRFSVQFKSFDLNNEPQLNKQDIPFKLYCCRM